MVRRPLALLLRGLVSDYDSRLREAERTVARLAAEIAEFRELQDRAPVDVVHLRGRVARGQMRQRPVRANEPTPTDDDSESGESILKFHGGDRRKG